MGEDKKLEIIPVTDKTEMISYWDQIQDTDLCDNGDPALVLQQCLTGQYLMSKGTVNGEFAGIVVFSPLQDGSCFVYILHLKNNVIAFRELFFEVCKKAGYKRILASTSIPEETYCRLTKLKKLYSVYEYDLTKEEI